MLEKEFGFITMKFNYPEFVYFEDMWVHPSKRGTKYAVNLVNEAVQFVKEKGYKKIVTSIWLDAEKGNEYSMKVMLNFGWKLDSLDQARRMIYLSKVVE